MRKIPDAYTATYGILSPRMRYHAENSAVYTLPCGKSPAHMRQHAVFNVSHQYSAILLLQDNYTLLCGKTKTHMR